MANEIERAQEELKVAEIKAKIMEKKTSSKAKRKIINAKSDARVSQIQQTTENEKRFYDTLFQAAQRTLPIITVVIAGCCMYLGIPATMALANYAVNQSSIKFRIRLPPAEYEKLRRNTSVHLKGTNLDLVFTEIKDVDISDKDVKKDDDSQYKSRTLKRHLKGNLNQNYYNNACRLLSSCWHNPNGFFSNRQRMCPVCCRRTGRALNIPNGKGSRLHCPNCRKFVAM